LGLNSELSQEWDAYTKKLILSGIRLNNEKDFLLGHGTDPQEQSRPAQHIIVSFTPSIAMMDNGGTKLFGR
jgi:hypothetical protein